LDSVNNLLKMHYVTHPTISMTCIAIASVNSPGLHLCQDHFNVAITEIFSLGKLSLSFKEVRDEGVLVVVGNPEFRHRKSNMFFASDIFDSDFEPVEVIYYPHFEDEQSDLDNCGNQQFRFRFLDKYLTDIEKLLKAAVDSSPVSKGYFWSDNPFGPVVRSIVKVSTINALLARHSKEGLVYNTLYSIGE
jgi:hypothetical protein